MAYIANKPVRFDRDYAIGERIPDEVIDLKMVNRLMDWGKIIKIKLPPDDILEKTDGEPIIDLFGVGLEESVINAEKILGIEYGDDAPGFEERAEICKSRFSELAINAQLHKDDEDDEDDGGEDKNIRPQNDNETNREGAELPQESNGEATGNPNATASEQSSEETVLPNVECLVCKRVMGSKGALTLHIKKEHPDYEI